jgi:hypothetical protein
MIGQHPDNHPYERGPAIAVILLLSDPVVIESAVSLDESPRGILNPFLVAFCRDGCTILLTQEPVYPFEINHSVAYKTFADRIHL